MPIVKLPFGEWKPDLGEWEHDGLYKVYGAVRSGGKWHPSPGFIAVDDVEPVTQSIADLRGVWLHHPNTGTEELYIGYCCADDIRIASINTGGTFFDAGATLSGTPDTVSGCQMTSYGNFIYYAAGTADNIARATHNSMSTSVIVFTSPDSYNPRPRYISTIKNHLLLAHVRIAAAPTGASLSASTTYPELVMWSATDNPLRFGDPSATPSATLIGSDFQQLFDECGPITGLIGGDYAFIFKSYAVWRMDGPPWQFRPVVQGSGTIYPNSICKLYDDVYFWGSAGPTRLRQGQATALATGRAKYTATLTDALSSELSDYLFELNPSLFETPSAAIANIDISGAVDYKNGLVVWTVGEAAVSSGTTLYRDTVALVYDAHTDELSSFKVNGKLRMVRSMPKTGTKQHSTIWAGTDTQDPNVLPGFFAVGSIGSVSGGVHTPATSTGAAKILVTYGDSTDSTVAYGTFPSQWAPQFIWPYRTFPFPPERDVTQVTSIKRVRIPWSLKRDATNPGDGDPAGKLVVTVKVRSKSRGADGDNYHETNAATLDTSSTTWQHSDGWIDIENGRGSVIASHHQLDVKFEAYETSASAKRWISHLRDFPYVEVEFTQHGTHGTEFRT